MRVAALVCLGLTESGKKFTLGAPFRGALFPGPDLPAKFEQSLDAWELMSPES